ncbi:hypothetical protein [Pedobacter sp. CG_S7]|uniref:hypothetical protein n=1 Tax=Pedobacter sp. CG_S7 TaxID=3143930 RepID=UPI00339A8043
MENPDNNELIIGISVLFKAHEETYEPGSWEKFSAQKKNKRPKAILWIGMAAALAIAITVVPYVFINKINDVKIVKQLTAPEKEVSDLVQIPVEKTKPLVIKNEVVKKAIKVSIDTTAIIAQTYVNTEITPTVTEMGIVVKPIPAKENNFLEYLENEGKIAEVVENKQSSKWNFGVELLPTVLQNKVNMGAGITTEFRLSKSFSISSGIAYVALDASKSIQKQSINMKSNKNLVSIDANISGIDIPLSLTYNLNKHIYTSVGVSYFNVLTDKRNNKYLTQLEVSSMAINPENGIMETFKTKLVEQNAEVSNESPLRGNSYLGFFNLSIGHKQEVFKQYNIVIEPFMKIPVGKLSNEDLKLGNGGVKLRFTF